MWGYALWGYALGRQTVRRQALIERDLGRNPVDLHLLVFVAKLTWISSWTMSRHLRPRMRSSGYSSGRVIWDAGWRHLGSVLTLILILILRAQMGAQLRAQFGADVGLGRHMWRRLRRWRGGRRRSFVHECVKGLIRQICRQHWLYYIIRNGFRPAIFVCSLLSRLRDQGEDLRQQSEASDEIAAAKLREARIKAEAVELLVDGDQLRHQHIWPCVYKIVHCEEALQWTDGGPVKLGRQSLG